MIIPKYLQIENVRGYCNAHCDMCAIANIKDKKIMSNEEFRMIIDKFSPYMKEICGLELVGMGESLIDPDLSKKISYAKSFGFKNVCVPTNVLLLSGKKSEQLLQSGIDMIVLGIDSLKKQAYESIRNGSSFETVMANARQLIDLRNEGKFETKIHVRMIEQEANQGEWDDYVTYWRKMLNIGHGDIISSFPIHNYADSPSVVDKSIVCPYIFDRMVISACGDVQFCSLDIESSFFDLGSIFERDPVEIFNNGIFNKSRNLMKKGEINKINPCKYCNVPLKRLNRNRFLEVDKNRGFSKVSL